MWFEALIAVGLCGVGGYWALAAGGGGWGGAIASVFCVASFVGAFGFAAAAATLRIKGLVGWIGQLILAACLVVATLIATGY
jgi:hypothetical protein